MPLLLKLNLRSLPTQHCQGTHIKILAQVLQNGGTPSATRRSGLQSHESKCKHVYTLLLAPYHKHTKSLIIVLICRDTWSSMDVGSGGSKWNWTISRLIWKRDHFFGQELHTTLLIGFSRQSAKPFRRKFSDNLCNKTEHCRWKEGATNQIVLKFSSIHWRINLKA